MVGRFLGEVKIISNAQILDTIEDMVTRAQQHIVIVSPYNDHSLPGRLRSAIEKAAERNVKITAVCRKGEEQKQRKYLDWLIGLGAEVYGVERLHAKIYSNESFGIVTSMNLRESSMLDSREIGVRLTMLSDIRRYVGDLVASGERIAPQHEVAKPKPQAVSAAEEKSSKSTVSGSCISCGKEIDYDAKRPRCLECHRRWDKNADSPEIYCHLCGHERANISFAKPLCRSCYRKASAT